MTVLLVTACALAAALVATVGVFAWLLDRRDARERAERADLLQRIQAPVQAVAEHAVRTAPVAPFVEPHPQPQWDDDGDYWQRVRGEPTRDELVEALERAEGV